MIQIILTDQPLIVSDAIDSVKNEESGGMAIFVGTVRNQTKGKKVLHLEFEAYTPMAIREMQMIAEQIKEKYNARHIFMQHRTGKLNIQETAVVIAVSTPHRKAAFEACQFAIDSLKETVPIWKKEFFEDGEVWVAAHP